MISSTNMLLRWQAEKTNNAELLAASQAIETALELALTNPKTRTQDIGGLLGCAAFGNIVKDNIFSGVSF